jgi:hypothetical protein
MKAILSVGLTSIHSLPDQINHGLSVRPETANLVNRHKPIFTTGQDWVHIYEHSSILKRGGGRHTFLHS